MQIKKMQSERILEMETQGKQIGTTDLRITNRIQGMEESQEYKIQEKKLIHHAKKI